MKAAVMKGPLSVEVGWVPTPTPGDNEVLLRVEGCGLGASSVPVYEGRPWFVYPQLPGAPGHEAWGTVVRVGAGVDSVRPGERVVALTRAALAEYDVAPADAVVALPHALHGDAVPGESLGCAMNVFRRSKVQRGKQVAIVGSGFLGTLLVQLAARRGAEVVAISRRRTSRDMALRSGAAFTLGLDYNGVHEALALTHGQGYPCVIEAMGSQEALDVAAALVGTRGQLVIAGFHQDGPRTIDLQAWNWRGIDVVNAHERMQATCVAGMRAAIAAVEARHIDPRSLYTHRFSLEHASEAFATLAARPEGFMKALVMP